MFHERSIEGGSYEYFPGVFQLVVWDERFSNSLVESRIRQEFNSYIKSLLVREDPETYWMNSICTNQDVAVDRRAICKAQCHFPGGGINRNPLFIQMYYIQWDMLKQCSMQMPSVESGRLMAARWKISVVICTDNLICLPVPTAPVRLEPTWKRTPILLEW